MLFFLGRYLEGLPLAGDFFFFVKSYLGTMTLLEFMGVAVVFFDLILNYEKPSMGMRRLRLLLTVIFVFAFLAKIFINYMDSALLE